MRGRCHGRRRGERHARFDLDSPARRRTCDFNAQIDHDPEHSHQLRVIAERRDHAVEVVDLFELGRGWKRLGGRRRRCYECRDRIEGGFFGEGGSSGVNESGGSGSGEGVVLSGAPGGIPFVGIAQLVGPVASPAAHPAPVLPHRMPIHAARRTSGTAWRASAAANRCSGTSACHHPTRRAPPEGAAAGLWLWQFAAEIERRRLRPRIGKLRRNRRARDVAKVGVVGESLHRRQVFAPAVAKIGRGARINRRQHVVDRRAVDGFIAVSSDPQSGMARHRCRP